MLLRGLAREAGHWSGFDFKFRQSISGAQVLTLDLPGTGRYHKLKSPLSIPQTMEFARADFLRFTQGAPRIPTYVLAVSMGAMVASEWLERYPDDLSGGVLINTSLGRVTKPWERLKPQALWYMWNAIRASSADAREEWILKMISQSRDIHPQIAKEWARLAGSRPVLLENVLRQLIACALYHGPAEAPVQPLLIMNSLGDDMVDPRSSQLLAKEWDAPLVTHPTAGHDLTLDDPQWVILKTKAWYESLRTGESLSAVQGLPNHHLNLIDGSSGGEDPTN